MPPPEDDTPHKEKTLGLSHKPEEQDQPDEEHHPHHRGSGEPRVSFSPVFDVGLTVPPMGMSSGLMEPSLLLLRPTIITPGAVRVTGTYYSMRENHEGNPGSEPPSNNETPHVEGVLAENDEVHPESDNQMEEILRTISLNAPLATVLNHPRGRKGQAQAELWSKDLPRHLLLAATLASVVAVISVGAMAMAGKIFVGGDKPAETVRIEKLKQELIAVSSEESLSDPTTPQFATLSWMALEDDTGLSSEAVVQRYIMALLYFSTGGNWTKPESPQVWNTCEYVSVLCWSQFEGIEMERSGGKAYLSKEWHECDWEGVGCNEGTDVVGAIDLSELNDNKEWWEY